MCFVYGKNITGDILSEFLDKKEIHVKNKIGCNGKSYSSLNVFFRILDQLFDTLENESEIQLFDKFILRLKNN